MDTRPSPTSNQPIWRRCARFFSFMKTNNERGAGVRDEDVNWEIESPRLETLSSTNIRDLHRHMRNLATVNPKERLIFWWDIATSFQRSSNPEYEIAFVISKY